MHRELGGIVSLRVLTQLCVTGLRWSGRHAFLVASMLLDYYLSQAFLSCFSRLWGKSLITRLPHRPPRLSPSLFLSKNCSVVIARPVSPLVIISLLPLYGFPYCILSAQISVSGAIKDYRYLNQRRLYDYRWS